MELGDIEISKIGHYLVRIIAIPCGLKVSSKRIPSNYIILLASHNGGKMVSRLPSCPLVSGRATVTASDQPEGVLRALSYDGSRNAQDFPMLQLSIRTVRIVESFIVTISCSVLSSDLGYTPKTARPIRDRDLDTGR